MRTLTMTTLVKRLVGKLNSFETISSLQVAHSKFNVMNSVTVRVQGLVCIIRVYKQSSKTHIKSLCNDEEWFKIVQKQKSL